MTTMNEQIDPIKKEAEIIRKNSGVENYNNWNKNSPESAIADFKWKKMEPMKFNIV